MDNDSNLAVRVKFNGPPQRSLVGDKLMKSLGRPKGCITIVTTLMALLAVSVEAQTFGSDSADFSGALPRTGRVLGEQLYRYFF